MMPSIESSIVLIDQYYGNNHYHVTMVLLVGAQIKYYQGAFSSCSIFMY